MRFFKPVICIFLLSTIVFSNDLKAQLSNIKAGLWSDATVWQNNKIPTSQDDVLLEYDIIIDKNAGCRSINNNGHNITVNSGVHFTVTATPLENFGDSVLSAVILLNTASTAPNDTLTIQNYFYDNQKRLEEIRLTESYHTEDEYESFVRYIYDGNNSLPNKLTEDDIYFHYRFYNAEGAIINDSVNFKFGGTDEEIADHTDNYHYSATGDTIFLKTQYYSTFNNIRYDTVVQIYQAGNVVSQKTLSQNGGLGYSLKLDDHPNPMYRSKYHFNFHSPFYAGDSLLIMDQQKNNYTEIINTDYEGSHNRYRYEYVYKQDGYPLFFRAYNISTGMPVYAGTGVYKYIKLD